MPSSRVTATISEDVLVEEDGEEVHAEFLFKVPVIITEEEGQKGRFGVPLGPDVSEVVVEGDITVVDPYNDEQMTPDEFVDRYGDEAQEAVDRVYEDDERLHEAASEEAHQQEMAHEQQKAEHKLAQRRGL